MDIPTYAEYLGSYVDTVQPNSSAYDNYALMEDGSLRDGYFQNLRLSVWSRCAAACLSGTLCWPTRTTDTQTRRKQGCVSSSIQPWPMALEA